MESDVDIEELRAWAREGAAVALRHFRHTAGRRKADRSWVTEADVEVERLLVERLAARYPGFGIVGEEQARIGQGGELVWAIDPIDGTASYVAGLPIWGISIGLMKAGRPHLGVFYMPVTDEMFWSEPGVGAFWNGEPVHVVGEREWDSEDWITVPSNSHRRFAIDFPGKTRSMGSSVADLCYVARGGSLGALLARCAIWDLAAGLAIVAAAGGAWATLSGGEPDLGAMLTGGSALPEPIVIAGPAHLGRLRAGIAPRQRA